MFYYTRLRVAPSITVYSAAAYSGSLKDLVADVGENRRGQKQLSVAWLVSSEGDLSPAVLSGDLGPGTLLDGN